MLVSVVTPSYNSAATIARCIKSVKSQDYFNIEHIIIDGDSNDGTVAMLRQLGVKFISEPDAGVYHAMNKGVQIATGEIIHILNADDCYSTDDTISKMVKFMKEGNYELCHGYVAQVDKQGCEVCIIGSDVSKDKLLTRMAVAHPSCFVRSSVYKRFGDYSSGFMISADHDFVLRLWSKIKVGFLPMIIVQMQWGGISNSNPVRSYKESMAVTLVHGKGMISALGIFCFECVKHYLVMLFRKLVKKTRLNCEHK